MFRTLQNKILSFKRKNPKLCIGIFAAVFIGLVLATALVIVPHATLAEETPAADSTTDTDTTKNGETDVSAVFRILGTLFLGIAGLLGKLLLVIIEILVGLMKYNDFINADAVTKGWYIVRDVCNMFFILILLIIAFSTILKIERYTYNKLLVRLIIMAVLINFSKAIAGFIIDVAQVIMMTFVNAFQNVAAGNFTSALQLDQMLRFRGDQTEPIGNWEYLGATIFAVAMMLVALVVMVAMVVVFLMRVIMLWILVVLSPLAYILNILPGKAQSYASQWWSKFFQWVTVGPILAFFIWLALTILTGGGNTLGVEVLDKGEGGTVLTGTAGGTGLLGATVTSISTSETLLSFIIAIAMLAGALMVAQQLGGVAGGVAGNMLGKIQKGGMGALKIAASPAVGAYKAARFGAKKGAAYVGKQLDRGQMKVQERLGNKTPVSLRPSVIKEAFSNWGAQRDREKYDVARGSTQDFFHKKFSGQKTDYAQRARRRLEQDEEGKILTTKDNELEFGFREAQEKGNQSKMAAYLRKLGKQGDLDNVVRNMGYKTQIDGSDNDYHAFIEKELVQKGGFKQQDAYRVGEDVGQLAEANGQYGLSRAFSFNVGTGEYGKLSPEDWAKTVAAQQAKRDPQVIARNNHRTAYVGETRVWEKLDGTIVQSPDGVQDDLAQLQRERLAAATDQDRQRIDNQIKSTKDGMLADLGFHEAGKLTFSGMDPQHAGRVQPNAIASIMFNNPEKAKELNPEMYKQLWQQLMVLNPDQLEKLENNAFTPVRMNAQGQLEKQARADLNSAVLGVATYAELGDKAGLKAKVKSEAIASGAATDEKDIVGIEDYYKKTYLSGRRPTGGATGPATGPQPAPAGPGPRPTTPGGTAGGPTGQGPAPVPRPLQVDEDKLRGSQGEYESYRKYNLSEDAYDILNQADIEAGKMYSSKELQRIQQARDTAGAEKMNVTAATLAAGSKAAGQRQKAGDAVIIGMDLSDPAVRQRYGIQAETDAVRFDSANKGRQQSKNQAAEMLVADYEKQLRQEAGAGADETVIAKQVAALKGALAENSKIVINNNRAPFSRLETIRGHEINGHDEAVKSLPLMTEKATGTLSEFGNDFYKSLSKEQQKLFDANSEEFLAESLGVGKGVHELSDTSKELLTSKGIAYAGVRPVQESVRQKLANKALNDDELEKVIATTEKRAERRESLAAFLTSAKSGMKKYSGAEAASATTKSIQDYFAQRKQAKQGALYSDMFQAIDKYADTVDTQPVTKALERLRDAEDEERSNQARVQTLQTEKKNTQQQLTQHRNDAIAAARRPGGADDARFSNAQAQQEQEELERIDEEINARHYAAGDIKKEKSEAQQDYKKAVLDAGRSNRKLRDSFAASVSKLSDQQLEQLLAESRNNIEDHNIAAAKLKTVGMNDESRRYQQQAWGNQALKEEAAKVLSSRVKTQTTEVQKTAATTAAKPEAHLPAEAQKTPEVQTAAAELESSEEVIEQVAGQSSISAEDFTNTLIGLENVVDRLGKTLAGVSKSVSTPQIPKDMMDKLVTPLKKNIGTVSKNGLFEGAGERHYFLYTLKQTFNDLRKALTGMAKQTGKDGGKSAGSADTSKVERTVQDEGNSSSAQTV